MDLSAFEIICIVGIVGFGIFLYMKAFIVFCFLESICNLIMRPIDLLVGFTGKLQLPSFKKEDYLRYPDGTRRHTPLSLVVQQIIMLTVFLASLIYIIVVTCISGSISDTFSVLLEESALIGVFALLDSNLSSQDVIGYAAMFSTAFSGFLSVVYMRCTVDAMEDISHRKFLYWTLIVLFNVVFITMSGLLSNQLENWFAVSAAFLLDLYHSIADFAFGGSIDTFWKVLGFIGSCIVLLLMLYGTLAAFAVVIREYLAGIMYGLFALFVLVVVLLISQNWLHLPDFIITILFLATLFFTEYIRANEKANHSFKAFMLEIAWG